MRNGKMEDDSIGGTISSHVRERIKEAWQRTETDEKKSKGEKRKRHLKDEK